jgi:hypothetical protein
MHMYDANSRIACGTTGSAGALRIRGTTMQEAARQVKAYEAVIQQSASRDELILEHMPQI